MYEWMKYIVNFVALPSVGRAIVMALLAGIMLTQLIKFQLPDWLTDKEHSRRIRLFSCAVTLAVCYALWPAGDTQVVSLVISTVVGISSPTIYWLAVKVLYHFWPWMDTSLSARPEQGKNP